MVFLFVPFLQTPKEYEREYSRELQQKGVEASKFHGFAYDGIWVIAKTLTRVMELLRIKQRQNTYHNFTVDDREVGKMVLDVMNETNFFGVTVSYGVDYWIFNPSFLSCLHASMCMCCRQNIFVNIYRTRSERERRK